MSDRTVRRADMPGGPTPAGQPISERRNPPSGGAAECPRIRELAVEIRGLRRARRGRRGARPVRRARVAGISVAPSGSPISICAMPPTPTRPSRTPSSRCSPHRIVSRGLAVRGLVHAHPHQRLSRPPQGARAPRRWFAPADEAAAPTRRARRSAAGRRWIRKRGCSRASGGPGSRPPSIGSTGGSGPSSCCVTTATARRAR